MKAFSLTLFVLLHNALTAEFNNGDICVGDSLDSHFGIDQKATILPVSTCGNGLLSVFALRQLTTSVGMTPNMIGTVLFRLLNLPD
jgi:hypothetical protein